MKYFNKQVGINIMIIYILYFLSAIIIAIISSMGINFKEILFTLLSPFILNYSLFIYDLVYGLDKKSIMIVPIIIIASIFTILFVTYYSNKIKNKKITYVISILIVILGLISSFYVIGRHLTA